MYKTDLATRAAWVRLIPRMLFGATATPFLTDGLSASQMRSFLDLGWQYDGDPAASPGWAALTVGEQTDLANDYADYLLRVAAGNPGVLRYGV